MHVTCSLSLPYLLSILLLYSRFYTLHISYSFYNLLLFISYHYFSDYVNFYHTFHISLRSVELILYYHIIYCHRFSHILSWLYTIPFVMFYFHVLLSCTIIIYCDHVLFHVLFSYTIFLLYFSYYFLFHVLYLFIYFSYYFLFHVLYLFIYFSNHFTFLYIFIYHVGLYNLMLQNLSSYSSAMLLISYHIFSHVIFKSFILCFIPVNTKEVDT